MFIFYLFPVKGCRFELFPLLGFFFYNDTIGNNVHVFMQTQVFISLGYMPRSGKANSYSKSLFILFPPTT